MSTHFLSPTNIWFSKSQSSLGMYRKYCFQSIFFSVYFSNCSRTCSYGMRSRNRCGGLPSASQTTQI